MKMRACLVAVLTVGSALSSLVPASAKAASHSFDGNCSVEGIVDFAPPATYVQQLLDVRYHANGTCSGTLDGKSISSAPVTMSNVLKSNGSCVYAKTVAPGTGSMTFAKGVDVAYTLEFTYVGTEGAITYTGRRSGSALGHGTFVTPSSSPDAASGCYDGSGVRHLTMDIQLVTDGPMVSDAKGFGR